MDTSGVANEEEQPVPVMYQVGTPTTPLTTQESALILNLHDSLMTATQTETDSVLNQEDVGPSGVLQAVMA